MEICTKACGTVKIDPEDILTFERGIIGFEGLCSYVLLGQPGDTLLWLQSAEEPDVAFVVINPNSFKQDYEPEIHIDDLKELDVDEESLEVLIYAIVVVPEDVKKMTANLRAPVIINAKNNKARQIVLSDERYKIKEPVFGDQ